ncbi:MAG: glycoside hydrolase family 15 protein [Actinomycetota bacterium]|nr:glycoside hydrolase family 15 protein [Actinomycetota bacterium]
MAMRIEDYALIGDTETAGLVGRDGSIDWLCLPRFDSGACFAALLGDDDHGRWSLRPAGEVRRVRRRYRPGTLVLETEFETDDGCVRLLDCMPPRDGLPDLVRVVEGVRGRVPMRMRLVIRFDYGWVVPWVRRLDGLLAAVAGPDALYLRSPVDTTGQGFSTVADFVVSDGDRVPFVLAWQPSHLPAPDAGEGLRRLADTESWWREWSGRSTYAGEWPEAVQGSLVTLKALTFAPTGGVVAAPTTSLPEQLGGVRNWDYRYCWLRDASFTLAALLVAGFTQEAISWRDWLLRAVAGNPESLQIMYGPAGERRLPELELPWLPGYEGSAPVRVGNAASRQFQLDVYGEVFDAMHTARAAGIEPSRPAWSLQRRLLEHLETAWQRADEGIWEVRGPRRHFTHSKVMAWVALDRAVKAVERSGLDGPVERWRATRDEIHDEVCRRGYDAEAETFVQHYGASRVDASLLMLPLVGFVSPHDPRMKGTVAAVERELCTDGLVARYTPDPDVDGLPSGEGAFLACSFWLVDNYTKTGRVQEARRLFERLLALRNDVGLLAEEYDPAAQRMVGNFPQAFSHVGLVNAADNLSRALGTATAGPGVTPPPTRRE